MSAINTELLRTSFDALSVHRICDLVQQPMSGDTGWAIDSTGRPEVVGGRVVVVLDVEHLSGKIEIENRRATVA